MLNWLARYALATALLDFDEHGQLTESVLDVGCGPHGLACAAPRSTFVGIDVAFPGPVAPGMIAFQSEPGPLPFKDGAFDSVVCLDVLEHVPPSSRADFVEELTRVAARRVLIACPSNDGAWGQEVLHQAYAQRGMPVPEWLSEHDEYGLPSPGEIAAMCSSPHGFTAAELPMTNGMLATMIVIADMLPEFAGYAAAEYQSQREGWLRAFEAAQFGHSTRRGYVIERDARMVAAITADDLCKTVWTAVRCPACGELGLRAEESAEQPTALTCAACGHIAPRNQVRAYDLRAPVTVSELAACQGAAAQLDASHGAAPELDIDQSAPQATSPPAPVATLTPPVAVPAPRNGELAPIRATAPVRLLLTPDWDDPRDWLAAVATFVATAPDGRHALCVDATATTLGLATVHEMLMTVCDAIAGDSEFGELVVLDTPFVRDGTAEIHTADDIRRHLCIPRPTEPQSAEQVSAHAVAAKRLLDRLAAIAHRRRFLDAPDPWSSREPLVTVRIATWRKPRVLVERAIPSVLNGDYRNVELLVCSDGHDAETAAAVAAIKDPRLRYMEMPERPVYPEQRWSLWEIAGAAAANRMVREARGSFIAPLCHDDAFTDDHLTTLLSAMAETKSDLAYGQALMEKPEGPWYTLGRSPLQHGYVTHGACLYSGRLRHMELDTECWVLREPGDWNLIRRVTAAGAKACFTPRVVLTHFAERSMVDHENVDTRDLDGFVADLERTGLSRLLEIPVRVPDAARV